MSGSGLGVGCKRVTQVPPPHRLQGGTHSGAWVQSLIRELGSHMLHSMVKRKKKSQICGRKGERERGKKGGREEGWTLSPEGWQELQVMSSAASAKWSLVSDPGEQGSGI